MNVLRRVLASIGSHVLSVSAGFALVLCALELLLRMLPVHEGINAADAHADWPIRTLQPHQHYTHSTGWHLGNVHHGSTNDYGYVSPFDYEGVTNGIAVFGDSYVESLMNEYEHSISGALARYLSSPTPVMNFGISGASMPHYLGSAPLIASRFKPDWAVVVVTTTDFYSGYSGGPGRYRWTRGESFPIELVPERSASKASKWIRSLALVRYVRGSLKMRMRTLFNTRPTAPDPQSSCVDVRLTPDDLALLHAFVDGFSPALSLSPSRVVMVFDADRKAIYEKSKPKPVCIRRDAIANQTLAALARARGYRVIDMQPIFTEHYARTRQQVDYLPEDGHWNALGHDLAAREVAKVILGESRDGIGKLSGPQRSSSQDLQRRRTHLEGKPPPVRYGPARLKQRG